MASIAVTVVIPINSHTLGAANTSRVTFEYHHYLMESNISAPELLNYSRDIEVFHMVLVFEALT